MIVMLSRVAVMQADGQRNCDIILPYRVADSYGINMNQP